MRQIKTQSNSGVALVYVLMALVFVGAVGMLVLDMAKKEKTDSGLRVSTEVARFSATAGLTFAASWFSNPDNEDDVLVRLNAWRTRTGEFGEDDPRRWIVGSRTEFPLRDDRMRFRVEIVNMDFSEFENNDLNNPINVMFRSTAIDQSGSRAENIGFYTIIGFEPEFGEPTMPEINTLHLGRINEVNTRLIVNGDTYIRDIRSSMNFTINNTGHIFNGQFVRMAAADNATTFDLPKGTFRGLTYFGALPEVMTPPRIWDNVGVGATVFERGFGTESEIRTSPNGIVVSGGDVFVNNRIFVDGSSNPLAFTGTDQTLHGSQRRGNGTEIDYGCAQNPGTRCLIRNGNPTTPALTPNAMNIPALMGINVVPTVLNINWNLPEFVSAGRQVINQGNITGAQLSGFGAGNLFRGWRVVEINGDAGAGTLFTPGGTFTGNTILIFRRLTGGNAWQSTVLDDGGDINFPVSAPGSRLVIISRDGTGLSRFTTANNGRIRGLLISEGDGRLLMGSGTPSRDITFEGAIHLTGNADYRLEGVNGSVTVDGNPDLVTGILDELNGFINRTNPNPPPGEIIGMVRRTDGTPITTTMRGRLF